MNSDGFPLAMRPVPPGGTPLMTILVFVVAMKALGCDAGLALDVAWTVMLAYGPWGNPR
jgi:hypothetical protein